MRRFCVLLLLVIASSCTSSAKPVSTGPTVAAFDRINPMIALQEKRLPVFGIAHPSIGRGGGGGRAAGGAGGAGRAGGAATTGSTTTTTGAATAGTVAGVNVAATSGNVTAATAPIPLGDIAKETVAYSRADYLFTSGTSETFLRYMEEITRAGGSMRTHPFTAKIGIWHNNPANVTNAIIRQLNAGHAGVSMEAVESAQEVRDVIKAMRFASVGGTRPDTGLASAAAYWGLTVEQYKRRADVWPINRNGELLVSVIVESLVGLEKVREIAAEPGVGQIFAGYGTLGGVFRGDPAGREAAAAKILAACKEFKIPCGFPTNNPAEMEQRMKEGWTVHIMQRRDSAGMAAVETGRRLGGR